MTTYLVGVGAEQIEVAVEETGGALRVSVDGRALDADAAEVLPGWYSLLVDRRVHDLGTLPRTTAPGARETAGPRRWTVVLDGYTYEVTVARGGRRAAGSGVAAGGAAQGHDVRAPMPGLVVAVRVIEGASVAAGDSLVTMEAMKMQMEIRAPGAGTVRKAHVLAGAEVSGGQVLITLG